MIYIIFIAYTKKDDNIYLNSYSSITFSFKYFYFYFFSRNVLEDTGFINTCNSAPKILDEYMNTVIWQVISRGAEFPIYFMSCLEVNLEGSHLKPPNSFWHIYSCEFTLIQLHISHLAIQNIMAACAKDEPSG